MIDVAAIVRAYCAIVFCDPPPGGMIALRGFAEPKGSSDNKVIDWVDPFTKHWMKGVESFVRTCDRRGCTAYCTPGFVNRRRADVLTLPTLVIDFDKGDVVDNYMKATRILGRPSLAVRSGGRINDQPKTHLYWRLRGDTTAERVTMLRGRAAALFGGDDMFGPGRAHQPIRIAGSVHRKAEPVPVEIAYTSPALDVEEAERQLVSVSAPRPTVNGGPTLTNSGLAKPETNENRVITEPWETLAGRLLAHEVVGYDADPGLTGTQREGISKPMLTTGMNEAEVEAFAGAVGEVMVEGFKPKPTP